MSVASKGFEFDDPFEPTAVAFSTPGYDGTAAMARCFVEEYALLGWPPERIYRLFTVPDFVASYSVMQERGSEYVKKIIASVMGLDSLAAIDGAQVVHMKPISSDGATGRRTKEANDA